MFHNVIFIATYLQDNAVQSKAYNVPIRNDYELETFQDDLELALYNLLDVRWVEVTASFN